MKSLWLKQREKPLSKSIWDTLAHLTTLIAVYRPNMFEYILGISLSGLNIGVFLKESWGENWPERFSNGVGIKISVYPQRVLMHGSSHQKSPWGELGCPERFSKKLAILGGLFFLLPFSAKIQGFFTYQTMHITPGREEIGGSFQKIFFLNFRNFLPQNPHFSENRILGQMEAAIQLFWNFWNLRWKYSSRESF